MVRKKLRNLKKKVTKKREKAEEKADLQRRIREQKRRDKERKREREKKARQRRISENNPDTIGEKVAVVKQDARDIASETRGIVEAKTGTDLSDVGERIAQGGGETSSELFSSSGGDAGDLYDNSSKTDRSIDGDIGGGNIELGEFDFDDGGGADIGSFDMDDDDDLFG